MRKPTTIFDEGEGLDLDGFSTKPAIPAKPPAPAIIAAAEAQNFQSREPKARPLKKPDRRHRTGRDRPFSTKVSEKTLNLLYEIHDANRHHETGKAKWTLGEILGFGIQAFKRDLDSGKMPEST